MRRLFHDFPLFFRAFLPSSAPQQLQKWYGEFVARCSIFLCTFFSQLFAQLGALRQRRTRVQLPPDSRLAEEPTFGPTNWLPRGPGFPQRSRGIFWHRKGIFKRSPLVPHQPPPAPPCLANLSTSSRPFPSSLLVRPTTKHLPSLTSPSATLPYLLLQWLAAPLPFLLPGTSSSKSSWSESESFRRLKLVSSPFHR